MKERPISFSTPMVRAIRDGHKIITRRVIQGTCPYGQPGDRLWVRESYRVECDWPLDRRVGFRFLADGAEAVLHSVTLTPAEWSKWFVRKYPYRATPGRFMYNSLCRLWLKVVSVRVERVQDIDEIDAKCEGVRDRHHFSILWDDLNAKRGFAWDSNPWVWRVEFRKLRGHKLVAPNLQGRNGHE